MGSAYRKDSYRDWGANVGSVSQSLFLEIMMKVKCIKSVTIGAMNLAFVEGKEYDIPAKDANQYSEYFQKHNL